MNYDQRNNEGIFILILGIALFYVSFGIGGILMFAGVIVTLIAGLNIKTERRRKNA